MIDSQKCDLKWNDQWTSQDRCWNQKLCVNDKVDNSSQVSVIVYDAGTSNFPPKIISKLDPGPTPGPRVGTWPLFTGNLCQIIRLFTFCAGIVLVTERKT